jgi:hypothetical protein
MYRIHKILRRSFMFRVTKSVNLNRFLSPYKMNQNVKTKHCMRGIRWLNNFLKIIFKTKITIKTLLRTFRYCSKTITFSIRVRKLLLKLFNLWHNRSNSKRINLKYTWINFHRHRIKPKILDRMKSSWKTRS